MQNLGKKCVSVCLMVLLTFGVTLTTGCGADQIISGLETADAVAVSAMNILAPVNPGSASILSKVDTGLKDVVKAYQDYESALPADKATKAGAIKAAVSAIQLNLSAILADVGVKNPNLAEDIAIGVAVVNSALIALTSKVTSSGVVTAQSAVVNGSVLPVIQGARTAKDLKNAWNNAVKGKFAHATI